MLICTRNTTNLSDFMTRLQDKKKSGSIPIIAEIKARTPRSGDLLKKRTITSIACSYYKGGAACLSVVTGKWFGGSNAMLRELAHATSLPILRKDFITNRRQIEQSKIDGASAVLLTKKLLTPNHLNNLVTFTLSVGLTPFVEVSDQNEIRGLHLPQEALVAVNNKCIQNKETDCGDIEKSLMLLEACRATGAGMVASASGICTYHQIQQLHHAGFDAFLIGTTLLQSINLQCTLEEFCRVSDQKVLS
jgi:indole-3-glycerol phosphate synthase